MNAFAEALTPKVAVSYLRVSTTEQARRGGGDDEGFSIPAQRDANKRKAASMGSMIITEFVDRGASARSANRPELQRMLEYVNDHDVDYVIVHKLDRLARNRSDDVEIVRALEAANVQLVSTTEAIDATPSGMLLHGIMSSIAEFYSRNLAAEVTKGLTTKAQRGGTVSKAPIGYLNHRTVDDQGRELRTVILDQERAQFVKDAFGLYATGAWTVSALADWLAERGFTTVPTPKVPFKPMSEKYLHRVLTNAYYRGIVTYKGVQYDGRHERLVSDETWLKVQGILDSHYNGDRVRKHNHYLKNSMWCGQCGERMLVTNSRSASGDIYPYFYCAGRHSKRTNCTQSSVLIYEIERKVEELYLRVQLDATFRDLVEAQMRAELSDARSEVERRRIELKKKQEQLNRERGKLMEAHYAGAIPVDLLGQEQDRISKALASIKTELDATNEKWEVIERNLGLALDLATNSHAAYLSAPEHIRRLFNQAFFEKILILPDENDLVGIRLEAERAEPFDTVLTNAKRPAGDPGEPLDSSSIHSVALTQSICLSKDTVVELRGFEPLAFSLRTRRATNCATAPEARETITSAPAPAEKRGRAGRTAGPSPTSGEWTAYQPQCRTQGQRWMRSRQLAGTAPAGPGAGWSSGWDCGSGRRGPRKPLPSAKSQNQSSRGSKLVITWWPVSCQCAVACCDGLVSQHPM
jgi:site-specific DNA recombinase